MDVEDKVEKEDDVKVEPIDPKEEKTDVISNAQVKLEILEEEPEEKLYSCDVCNKKFIIRALWTSHMKTHDPNKDQMKTYPYSCKTCHQKFRRNEFLELHEANCRPANKPSKFTDLTERNEHQKKCLTWCGVCSKFFSNRQNLKKHMFNQHPEDGRTIKVLCTVGFGNFVVENFGLSPLRF